ncbi:MAG: PDZ domain-containing protein, partial [Zestosphaera sp.]
WLGVYVTPLTEEAVKLYELPVNEGVVIVNIVPGSPADKHGLAIGDIIFEANNKPVRKVSDLRAAIEESISYECVDLKIIRGHRTISKCVPPVVERLY